jgi:hypothetical protein
MRTGRPRKSLKEILISGWYRKSLHGPIPPELRKLYQKYLASARVIRHRAQNRAWKLEHSSKRGS